MKVKKQYEGKKNNFNKSMQPSTKDERVNPFELKINKKKHSVLGQKLKSDRGNPGISRNRINKKRLEMLQKSTQMRRKSNSFIDKRFGQYDDSMSKEDLIIARMNQSRQKRYKKNIYNLNDEEDDHFAKALLGLEDPKKNLSDSEDDEDTELNADYVNELHFGGFLTKKSEGDKSKSRKEVIEDIIMESKRRKAEKKAEKEMTEDMTDELDKEWKQMLGVVSSMRRKDDEVIKTKADSYDITVGQLKFEPFTAVKNVKTEEQLKKEAAEKMKKLEQERINRMNPAPVEKDKRKESEMSADSLYDGLEIDEELSDRTLPQEQFQGDGDDNEDSDDSDDDDYDPSDILMQLDQEVSNSNKMYLVKLPSGDSEILTLDMFSKLMKDKSLDEISSTIDSMLKDNHSSLREGNKIILENLFSVILNYLCENVEDLDAVNVLNIFVPRLYTLSEMSPVNTGISFQAILMESFTSNKDFDCSPSVATLMLLKLVSCFYSTSDFRHPVVTVAFLIMSDILSTSYKITAYNLLSRLFVCGLFYEYLAFSKRFAVEPINFLKDSLFMSASKVTSYEPQHKNVAKKRELLLPDSSILEDPLPIKFNLFCQSDSLIMTDNLKVLITYTTVRQMYKFSKLYENETIFSELFANAAELCKHLSVESYPSKVGNSIKEFEDFVAKNKVKRTHLKFPNKRPRMLKMLEPNFEMNDNSKKSASVTFAKKLRAEKELSQKIKKEQKGVMREIRRDAQFLAREQLRERMEADSERKMKVKKLCHELAMQEGECKKFSRKK